MKVPSIIKIASILALDYYDGPSSGVFATSGGACYLFDSVARDEKRDLFVFCIAAFPKTSNQAEQIQDILKPYIPKKSPVWIPIWKFPDLEAQQRCELQINKILSSALPYSMKLVTRILDVGTYKFHHLTTIEVEQGSKFRKNRQPLTVKDWINL